MAIYIKDTLLSTIGLGSTSNPSIYIDDDLVFPTGVVTHALIAVGVYYSDGGTYLKPDQSNYGYVGGTYVTYIDGEESARTIVECTPQYYYTTSYITIDGNHFLWNKAKYGSEVVYEANWIGLTGGTYDDFTVENKMSMKYGANSKNFNSAKVNSLTLNPASIASSASTVYTTIKGVRNYTWTSGNAQQDVVLGGSYKTNVSAYTLEVDDRQAANPQVAYYFTNNGSEAVTINYYFWVRVSYMDSEFGREGYDDGIVSGTTTVAAGATKGTGTFNCPVSIPETAENPTISDYETYFYFNNDSEKRELETTVQTFSYTVDYGSDYYQLSSSDSWATVSGMTLSVAENTGSSARQGTITVTDKLDSTATSSATLIQAETGVTYTMDLYYEYTQEQIESRGQYVAEEQDFNIIDFGDNLRQYTVTTDDDDVTVYYYDNEISLTGYSDDCDFQVRIDEASSGQYIIFEVVGPNR